MRRGKKSPFQVSQDFVFLTCFGASLWACGDSSPNDTTPLSSSDGDSSSDRSNSTRSSGADSDGDTATPMNSDGDDSQSFSNGIDESGESGDSGDAGEPDEVGELGDRLDLMVWLGTGNGSFSFNQKIPMVLNLAASELQKTDELELHFADLNGDSLGDFHVSHASQWLSQNFLATGPLLWQANEVDTMPVEQRPAENTPPASSSLVADFNGDTINDVAWLHARGQGGVIRWGHAETPVSWTSATNLAFQANTQITGAEEADQVLGSIQFDTGIVGAPSEASVYSIAELLHLDADKNGQAEASWLHLLSWDGVTFQSSWQEFSGPVLDLVIADADGDGINELVTLQSNAMVSVYTLGASGFEGEAFLSGSSSEDFYVSRPGVYDFVLDERPDFLYWRYDSQARPYREENEGGLWIIPGTDPYLFDGFPHLVVTSQWSGRYAYGDTNSDGLNDFLVQHSDGYLALALALVEYEDEPYELPENLKLNSQKIYPQGRFVFQDLNGDDIPDLAALIDRREG